MRQLMLNNVGRTAFFYKPHRIPEIKLMVFNLGGTVIKDKTLVNKTLFKTIKGFGINIPDSELSGWDKMEYQTIFNRYLNNYLVDYTENTTATLKYKANITRKLEQDFNNNLIDEYDKMKTSDVDLIDSKIPSLFNKIRENNIKIAVTTSQYMGVLDCVINKFQMLDYIDGYISSNTSGNIVNNRPTYPYAIHQLMHTYDIESSKSVIKIGDTRNDIMEGINAGCSINIGVLSGYGTPEGLFKSGLILDNIMDIRVE